jgi:hypothetical protein
MTPIERWHHVVNERDLPGAHHAVSDPVVVSGPRGAGRISAAEFADWVTRSGVEMRATALHPITERITVAEQTARWPQSTEWTPVATVFRTTGDRISAALRFPDLAAALDFARAYAELAATEQE